jgi:hypothetical protein
MLLSKISAGVAVGTVVMLGSGFAVAASGWSVVPAPPSGHNAVLIGVSSTSDSDAWAVGSQNGAAGTGIGAKPLIDHWDGTTWSQVTTPATPGNTASLAAVSASSPTDAWAVGHTRVNKSSFAPLAMHWTGTGWAVSPSAASALAGQVGVGAADINPTDAYAIGGGLGSAHTGQVAHWNGSSWARVTVPLPANNNLASDLNAISADGASDVWIVGTYELQVGPTAVQNETYSLHWNGSSWTIVAMPLEDSSNVNNFFKFSAIKANSPSDVWAVGRSGVAGQVGSGATLIEHWDGTAWSIVPSPSPGLDGVLTGVTTKASNDMWAVGYDRVPGTIRLQTLTLHWNGTTWATVASPNAGSVSSVLDSVSTTPGATIVQAVGYSGVSGSFNPFALRNG